MVACSKCLGAGVAHIRPSRKVLHEHRVAEAAAAQQGRQPPARPAARPVPCSACAGVGLQDGPPPAPLGSEPPTVAIVGGGIGGAALALALQQRGVAVQVYERDGCFAERAQGYGLTMQQGATALKQLGLPNEGVFSLAHHSFLPDGSMIGSYGRAIYETTREVLGNGKGEQQRRNAHIPRQQLREKLLAGLAEGTVQWGRRLQACVLRWHELRPGLLRRSAPRQAPPLCRGPQPLVPRSRHAGARLRPSAPPPSRGAELLLPACALRRPGTRRTRRA